MPSLGFKGSSEGSSFKSFSRNVSSLTSLVQNIASRSVSEMQEQKTNGSRDYPSSHFFLHIYLDGLAQKILSLHASLLPHGCLLPHLTGPLEQTGTVESQPAMYGLKNGTIGSSLPKFVRRMRIINLVRFIC